MQIRHIAIFGTRGLTCAMNLHLGFDPHNNRRYEEGLHQGEHQWSLSCGAARCSQIGAVGNEIYTFLLTLSDPMLSPFRLDGSPLRVPEASEVNMGDGLALLADQRLAIEVRYGILSRDLSELVSNKLSRPAPERRTNVKCICVRSSAVLHGVNRPGRGQGMRERVTGACQGMTRSHTRDRSARAQLFKALKWLRTKDSNQLARITPPPSRPKLLYPNILLSFFSSQNSHNGIVAKWGQFQGNRRQAAFELFGPWAALASTLSRVFQFFNTELKL
jgi:hypothetical protein